jgi:hypothetical protein
VGQVENKIVGLAALRKAGAGEQEALRLRRADRRHARAGPLHLQLRLEDPRPRFIESWP